MASTDPALERRLSEVRARAIHHPVGREGLVRTLVAVFFFSCAFAVAYTLASSIGFELGAGQALPTELVLVPMLFVLPAALVPMIIAAGLALAAACEVATGALSLRRAVVWPPVNSVFAFGPALVFVIGGEPQGDAHGAAVLAVAVVTQLAVDVIASSGLESVGNGVSPRELIRPLAWAFSIDTLLALLGYLAAVAARVEPIALLLPIPIVGLLALFARERRERLGLTHDGGARNRQHAHDRRRAASPPSRWPSRRCRTDRPLVRREPAPLPVRRDRTRANAAPRERVCRRDDCCPLCERPLVRRREIALRRKRVARAVAPRQEHLRGVACSGNHWNEAW